MTTRAAVARGTPAPEAGAILGAVLCTLLALIMAALLVIMGYWALLVPFYGVLLLGTFLFPERFAFVVLGLGIAVEPGALDFTGPLANSLYEMPPALTNAFPMTVSPFELLLVITMVSLWFRTSRRKRDLPGVLWLVPVVYVLGFAYGYAMEGKPHLAYNEARGLLYGLCAFAIVLRLGIDHPRSVRWAILGGGLGLSIIVIIRYFFYLRPGIITVPPEAAFAHEDSPLLGIVFVVGCALLVRTRSMTPRLLLIGYELIVLVAVMASGRRSGFLVLFVGAVVMIWLLFPKRPHLVAVALVPIVTFGSLYLGAYWNKEYGALAQPARAIRSQFDPSARDESSDQYRVIEKLDVEQTIRSSRLFGVGFGRPFTEYARLPDLTSFWPLQAYTPHTNVLWLWLKMGVLGVSVMLAVWVLALKRCLVAYRARPRSEPVPVLPLILACALVMYLAYARVDLALVSARSFAPLAGIVAAALCLPGMPRKKEGP